MHTSSRHPRLSCPPRLRTCVIVVLLGSAIAGLPVLTLAGTRSPETGGPLWETLLKPFRTAQDGGDVPIPNPGVDPNTLVAGFRSCVRQWTLFVGETYTIVPVPVDARGGPVACANVTFVSDNPTVATVTSWGEVEALAIGVANITVRCGGASADVTIAIIDGRRPVLTDDEWAIEHLNDCVAIPTQIGDKTDYIDDSADTVAPDTTTAANEVGAPRLSAMEYPPQSAIKARHNYGSSNYGFSAPVLALGGREAGIGLALTYNGQLWEKDVVSGTTTMKFNYGRGWPAAGWRFGLGRIIENYDAAGSNNHLLIQPDGTKIALVYDTASTKCLSRDGTFLEYGPVSGKLKYPDGTIVKYDALNNRRLPTSIQSPNGNVITIAYRTSGSTAKCAIDVITDTLGRLVTFHYYGDAPAQDDGYVSPAADANNPAGALYSVRVEDRGFVPGGAHNKRELVRVSYTNLAVFPSNLFAAGITVDAPSTAVTAVAGIYYPATGTGYTFDYASSYGMATSIHVRKDMTGTTGGTDIARTDYGFPTTGQQLNNPPRFSSRTEWRDNGAGGSVTASYSYANGTSGSNKTYTVTATSASPDTIVTVTTVGTTGTTNGRVISMDLYKNSVGSTNRMQTVAYTYIDAPIDAGGIFPTACGQVVKDLTTTNEHPASEVSKVVYFYTGGSYGQVKKVDEYDFGAATKLRSTTFTYLNTWSTTNYKQNLFYLVTNATIADGAGTVMARTDYAYDSYPVALKNYLPDAPPAATRDATYDSTTYAYRGNLTSTTRYANAAAGTGAIVRNLSYDIFGNVVAADVNCCSQKVFTFQGQTNGTGLYFSVPTSVTDGPTGGPNLTNSATYDFANSTVLTSTDERLHQTTMTYDAAWRPKTVTDPSFDNGTARNVVRTFNYDVGNPGKDQLVRNDVLTYYDNGTLRTITSQVWLDGMGHVVRQGTSPAASGSYDAVRMSYDSIGRMSAQTNPYAGDANGNPTGSTYSTSYSFDALSRAVTVTLPDGNTISTAFVGKTTTVTDQVGRQRRMVVDGLGRLVTVYEQNPGSGALDWTTTYLNDVFGNVTDVKMYASGGSGPYQQRTASYDGLSRLVSRTTPEVNNQTGGSAGTPVTETFTYTDFDAVDVYTDGRGTTTDYGFDGLNRLTSIAYATNGAPGAQPTLPVAITYELVNANTKGLVTKVTDYNDGGTPYGETYTYESNNLGRLQSRTRSIGTTGQAGGGRRSYTVGYTYNSIGQALTTTYPSSFTAKMDHDTRGRLSAVTKNGTSTKYLSALTYNSAGLVEGFDVNDNNAGASKVVEDYNYSADRLQLTNQSATRSSTGFVLMNFNYSYAAEAGESGPGSTAGNSGQLMGITTGSQLNGIPATQGFTYDTVGRLLSSTGSSPGSANKGTDTPGTFDATPSFFYLRNSNSAGPADLSFGYGPAPSMWVPIKGDWDGDGIDTVGLYDPSTSTFYLKNSNAAGPADLTFQFGLPGLGYVPVSGDWDGDGADSIGLYRPSTGGFVLRDTNAPGAADYTFTMTPTSASMKPIAGDWNNDGIDTIGVYDSSTGGGTSGYYYLRNSNTSGTADITPFQFGSGGATPLAGDWDGANGDSIGFYDPATSNFFLKNTNTGGAADYSFNYGAAGSAGLAGDWDGVTGSGGVPQSDARRFAYDRWGNRTAVYNSTSGTTPAAQTVSLQPLSGQTGVPTNRINQVMVPGLSTMTYAHDKAGDVTSDGINTFAYDVAGRTVSATVGAQVSTYVYDAGNRRTQKQVGSTPATDYVWEGGQVLAEYDRNTATWTDYVWAGGRMVATVRGATTTFYFQDRLSTRLSTDSNGAVIGTQSHFPFGEDAGSTGTTEKHRFTSYEHDPDSASEYALNRLLTPETGRFRRPDPTLIGHDASADFNRYTYCNNDAINYADPSGLLLYIPPIVISFPPIFAGPTVAGPWTPPIDPPARPDEPDTDTRTCADALGDALRPANTDEGLLARLIFQEATGAYVFAAHYQGDRSDSSSPFRGMPVANAYFSERYAIAATVFNRVAFLGQPGPTLGFGARGSGVSDVIGSRGATGTQYQGFSYDARSGQVAIASGILARLNKTLASSALSVECGDLTAAVYTANEFMNGRGVDPFGTGMSFSMFTRGHGSPGGVPYLGIIPGSNNAFFGPPRR